MNIQLLHDIMAIHLLEAIPGLQRIYCYDQDRASLPAPVGFLEISNIEFGSDPGTEELPLVLTLTLRLLVDAALPKADIALQSLMVDAARAVFHQNFGLPLTMSHDLALNYDTTAETEQILIGQISWKHEAHFGDNIWEDSSWIPPHRVHAVYSEHDTILDETQLDGNVRDIEETI
jgi:hypothetical protein